MGRIEDLAARYERHISVPWQRTIAGAQRVVLVVYEKEKAITVPAKAVFSEEADEDQRFVHVRTAEDKMVKRPVTVGRQKGDRLEIVEGLTDGEVILLEKPEK